MNNNIDQMMIEVERRLKEAEKQQNDAIDAQKLANEMKEKAIKQEKEAKAAMKELENARAYAAKAKESYEAFRGAMGDSYEESVVETKNIPADNTATNTNNNKSNGLVKGIVIGATAVALLATGTWALSKDSKTGKIRAASLFGKNNIEDSNTETNDANIEYTYDYSSNVVTVSGHAYDFENSNVNETLPANIEYVPFTTEKFEELTSSLITKYERLGLNVSRENIIKYVMIRNLDRLRQDNNELVNQIIGSQDVMQVFTDGFTVCDAIRNYNILYYDKYRNTDGFISATDGVFDEVQKARATEIETRVYEIATYYYDNQKYNELTYALLRDLYNPLNPISQLEDGVSYGVQSIDMYMIRAGFGLDRFGYNLDETNADLIKYFVSFVEDDDLHQDNSLMNGNVTNIYRQLLECTETKTLTK